MTRPGTSHDTVLRRRPREAAGVMLRVRAYERFTQQLVRARLRPGQLVTQRELAALTRMPLGAIREMIPRLEAEGLIRTVPQRGLQIANVDVRLVHNAFQLRRILEGAAITRFVETASDAEIARLEAEHLDIVRRAETGIDDRLLDDAQAVDWGLHDRLIDSLDNDIVSSIYRVNSLKIRLIRFERVVLDADALLPAMREHLALVRALGARDGVAAAAALDRHLGSAQDRALGK